MQRITREDTVSLRHFCFTLAAAIPVMFGVVLPWLYGYSPGLWSPAVGGVILLLGVAAPGASYPLYRGWIAVAGPLGWLNTRLLLGLVFFGLIVPCGWLLRLSGKLQYTDKVGGSTDSYRIPVAKAPTSADLGRPY